MTVGPKHGRPNMKKFLVLYLVPPSVIEDWSKTAPDVRGPAQEKMRGEWNAWMASHAKMITDTAAGGKTKLVSTSGVSDTKNNIMLYSFVEADSHEAAAKAFEGQSAPTNSAIVHRGHGSQS